MRTEVRSGVPRPAWVVEDRPGKRDYVRIPGAYDSFCLLKLGNETYSNNRDPCSALSGTRGCKIINLLDSGKPRLKEAEAYPT